MYRRTRIPDLRGLYVCSDNCDGRIRALRLGPNGRVAQERFLGVEVEGPAAFGEDANGELYVLGREGIFSVESS